MRKSHFLVGLQRERRNRAGREKKKMNGQNPLVRVHNNQQVKERDPCTPAHGKGIQTQAH
jgi:hypothetical protein